jgi:hypothetical protein
MLNRTLLAAVPLLLLGACAQPQAASEASAEAPAKLVNIGITGMT